MAEDVFAVTGKNPLLKTAMALHDAALKVRVAVGCSSDPAGRLLCVAAAVPEVRPESVPRLLTAGSVDFWSGLIYQSMGFPACR